MSDLDKMDDFDRIDIDQVGVSDLRYPITVLDPSSKEGKQETVANLLMAVSRPHHFKGTHMSRFIEVLNEHRGEVTLRTLPKILHDLRARLESESARIELTFPYFLRKEAPVSREPGLMEYECSFVGEANDTEDDFVFSVRVPVTTLCPYSKEISERGAHNQRGYVNIEARTCRDSDGVPEIIWIEELVEIADLSSSSPVYALLKRPDEKAVTEQAYENPVYVEDIVRGVAKRMIADLRVSWFRVNVINQESIHNHSSFAKLEWTRK